MQAQASSAAKSPEDPNFEAVAAAQQPIMSAEAATADKSASAGHSVNAAKMQSAQDAAGEPSAPPNSSPSRWQPTAECPNPVAISIERKLKHELQAVHVAVLDESAQHAGHAGAKGVSSPSGETHMRVEVVSNAFEGLNTVKRHRLVYSALSEELAGPVHALTLITKSHAEAGG